MEMPVSLLDDLIAGWIGGSVGGFFQTALMCPVELIKTALQTSTEGKSSWVHNMNIIKFEGNKHAVRTILKLKGWRGLFKGFVPMMIRDVPTSGLFFVIYEMLLPPNKNDVQWFHNLWAGGWAGIWTTSTVLPADVIKTRMQADDLLNPNYNGMLDCAKKLYQEEGFRIFWKGLPVITVRAFPAHAMLFIVYEMTMDALKNDDEP
ncbi:solute carrier family 25 member 45-like isoform X2 [Anthonomus grandis grandis]|uniref:solute carrier family 25 member 45-like isoform X2 n=1 Tax=Anthonomus grandis grandis TaxID=2921223 RepID=UPI002165B2F4|nr:solute carrier family 25 member 45-like isoform X2 [Anthonomus grandis grandis]